MYTARLSANLPAGGRPLCSLTFYLDRVVPINHSWHQKTRDTGLPDSKDRISVFPCFDTIPECDGRTDALPSIRCLQTLRRTVKIEATLLFGVSQSVEYLRLILLSRLMPSKIGYSIVDDFTSTEHHNCSLFIALCRLHSTLRSIVGHSLQLQHCSITTRLSHVNLSKILIALL